MNIVFKHTENKQIYAINDGRKGGVGEKEILLYFLFFT